VESEYILDICNTQHFWDDQGNLKGVLSGGDFDQSKRGEIISMKKKQNEIRFEEERMALKRLELNKFLGEVQPINVKYFQTTMKHLVAEMLNLTIRKREHGIKICSAAGAGAFEDS